MSVDDHLKKLILCCMAMILLLSAAGCRKNNGVMKDNQGKRSSSNLKGPGMDLTERIKREPLKCLSIL